MGTWEYTTENPTAIIHSNMCFGTEGVSKGHLACSILHSICPSPLHLSVISINSVNTFPGHKGLLFSHPDSDCVN